MTVTAEGLRGATRLTVQARGSQSCWNLGVRCPIDRRFDSLDRCNRCVYFTRLATGTWQGRMYVLCGRGR